MECPWPPVTEGNRGWLWLGGELVVETVKRQAAVRDYSVFVKRPDSEDLVLVSSCNVRVPAVLRKQVKSILNGQVSGGATDTSWRGIVWAHILGQVPGCAGLRIGRSGLRGAALVPSKRNVW